MIQEIRNTKPKIIVFYYSVDCYRNPELTETQTVIMSFGYPNISDEELDVLNKISKTCKEFQLNSNYSGLGESLCLITSRNYNLKQTFFEENNIKINTINSLINKKILLRISNLYNFNSGIHFYFNPDCNLETNLGKKRQVIFEKLESHV